MKNEKLFRLYTAIFAIIALIGVYYFMLTENIFWFGFCIFVTLFLDNQMTLSQIMEKLNNE